MVFKDAELLQESFPRSNWITGAVRRPITGEHCIAPIGKTSLDPTIRLDETVTMQQVGLVAA